MLAIKLAINVILLVFITTQISPAFGTESIQLALNDGHMRSPSSIGTQSIQSCFKDEDCETCVSEEQITVKGCCVANKCSCVLKGATCTETFSQYTVAVPGRFLMWSTFDEEEQQHNAKVTIAFYVYNKADTVSSASGMYSSVDDKAIRAGTWGKSSNGAGFLATCRIEPDNTKQFSSSLVSRLNADELLEVLKEDVLDQLLKKYKNKYPNKVL